jgi:hypothetical protein
MDVIQEPMVVVVERSFTMVGIPGRTMVST